MLQSRISPDFHRWSVTRAFQSASSVPFATEERADVLDRYVEHSDRVKGTEGVLWDDHSRSTGEKFGLTLSGEK